MKNYKLFLIVAAVFIGAVIFLSDPFSDKKPLNHSYTTQTAANSSEGDTVVITDEAVAMGIPGAAVTAKINGAVIVISVAVINLAGALVVIFLSGEQKA